jgi:hypothetical protein
VDTRQKQLSYLTSTLVGLAGAATIYAMLDVLLSSPLAGHLTQAGYGGLLTVLNYQLGFFRITRAAIAAVAAWITAGVAYVWLNRRRSRQEP